MCVSKIAKPPQAPDRGDELAQLFGSRVRALRDASGMTLQQLAQSSGVSRAMLSKVERGEKSPTIGIASRIARSLQTSLTELTGDQATDGTTVVLRRADRPTFRDAETGFERHLVSPSKGSSGVEVVYHYLPAGVSTGMLPPFPAGTEKQIVVTLGHLILDLKDGKVHLGPGDSLFFIADVEHGLINPTDEPCGYYVVISHQR